MKAMNKAELIALITQDMAIHHDRTVSKADVAALLDSLAAIAGSTLIVGGELTLPGIGKLTVVERAARAGRNPRTGEAIEIEARRVVRFQPITGLKTAVLGQPER